MVVSWIINSSNACGCLKNCIFQESRGISLTTTDQKQFTGKTAHDSSCVFFTVEQASLIFKYFPLSQSNHNC